MTRKAQVAELVDTVYALVRVMEEESDILALSGPTADVAELARAKIRLTQKMEELHARLNRASASWLDELEPEQRTDLTEATDELHRAATVNSDVLERQISLSTDMLQAVGKELERVSGRQGTTYSRLGDIRRMQASAPLSVNGRY